VTWCFDGIQVVPGWERFVRRLLDSENVEVFLSGSSARMLSREVATSMRGRALETVITPFSFREFARVRGAEWQRGRRVVGAAERSAWLALFDDYLEMGGFPEAGGLALPRERIGLLQGYVDSVLFRDVVERHGIGNIVALRALVRQLLRQAASHFSGTKSMRISNRSASGPRRRRCWPCSGTLKTPFSSSLCRWRLVPSGAGR